MKKRGICPQCGSEVFILSVGGNLIPHTEPGSSKSCDYEGLPDPGSIREEFSIDDSNEDSYDDLCILTDQFAEA